LESDPLERSWELTRRHLARAVDQLRACNSTLSEAALARLEAYREVLENNELELGLDLLEAAAQAAETTPRFWEAMVAAAASMGLHERAEALAERARASP
jgi:hypothetical protein